MAEGTTLGLGADAGEEPLGPVEAVEEEACGAPALPISEVAEEPVVRPKQRSGETATCSEGEEVAREQPHSVENWWQSPAVTGLGQARGHPSGLMGAQFQGWRERRWIDDEEGDWSQSTGVGATTLDVLRDRFGEASFRDAPSWQPWAPSGERIETWGTGGPRSGPGRKMLLASPKLRLRPRRTVPPGEGEEERDSRGPPSSLREALKGPEPRGVREERDVGGGRRMGQRSAPQDDQGLGQGPAPPLQAWAPGGWPPQMAWGLPPIQASFNGDSEKVALFLSQIISHMDLYGHFYPSQWSMVVAVTGVLTGEAASWVADLHREHARDLTDLGWFLEALRTRFEDDTQNQITESEMVAIRQRGRPAKDYVKEFRALAGRLRTWPEKLLVHRFHSGLDRDLRQACLYRGLASRLSDWYKAAVELDIGLREFKARPWGAEPTRRGGDRRGPDKRLVTPGAVAVPSSRPPFQAPRTIRCYRCDQEGHRALECPIPPLRTSTPRGSGPRQGGRGGTPRPLERTRAALQHMLFFM